MPASTSPLSKQKGYEQCLSTFVAVSESHITNGSAGVQASRRVGWQRGARRSAAESGEERGTPASGSGRMIYEMRARDLIAKATAECQPLLLQEAYEIAQELALPQTPVEPTVLQVLPSSACRH